MYAADDGKCLTTAPHSATKIPLKMERERERLV
jgi:hypothetical protein